MGHFGERRMSGKVRKTEQSKTVCAKCEKEFRFRIDDPDPKCPYCGEPVQ